MKRYLICAAVAALLGSSAYAQTQVGGSGFGTLTVFGEGVDVVRGPDQEVQGLAQWWYEGNKRTNVDFFYNAGEGDTTDLVNPGQVAFATEQTWWAGSGDRLGVPRYPADALAGTRFTGGNQDNYGVRLLGEIFVPQDGDYFIRDGIDDYTMLAIDLDGNGLDSREDMRDSLDNPSGDIVVHDDDWADWNGGSQPNTALVEFENVDAGGEWREIELWMSEGGGGDSGNVFMAFIDDLTDDEYDEFDAEDALPAAMIAEYLIPAENLRGTVPGPIESGSFVVDATGEWDFQVSSKFLDSDTLIAQKPEGNAVSIIDLSNATVNLIADSALNPGDEFVLFVADEIIGEDTVTFVADDLSAWDFSGLADDIRTGHRIQYVGSNAAASVPEPTGAILLSIACLFAGALRRRRVA